MSETGSTFEALTVGLILGCIIGVGAFDFSQFELDEAMNFHCRRDPLHHYHYNNSNNFVRKNQKSDSRIVEVCLSDIASVEAALLGGANSIELCSNRAEGGVTPSEGLVEQAVQRLRTLNVRDKVTVHVLIRPRAGDFVYSADEFDVIIRDIRAAKRAGADGIVVGLLTSEGALDVSRLRIVRSIAGNALSLTFHRAFDTISNCVEDPISSLETLISLGFERLLTSGRRSTSELGISTLATLVQASRGRIQVVGAAGVGADMAQALIEATGLRGVHAGSAVSSLCARGGGFAAADGERVVDVGLARSGGSNSSVSWEVVDATKVAALCAAANAGWDSTDAAPSLVAVYTSESLGEVGSEQSAVNDDVITVEETVEEDYVNLSF